MVIIVIVIAVFAVVAISAVVGSSSAALARPPSVLVLVLVLKHRQDLALQHNPAAVDVGRLGAATRVIGKRGHAQHTRTHAHAHIYQYIVIR